MVCFRPAAFVVVLVARVEAAPCKVYSDLDDTITCCHHSNDDKDFAEGTLYNGAAPLMYVLSAKCAEGGRAAPVAALSARVKATHGLTENSRLVRRFPEFLHVQEYFGPAWPQPLPWDGLGVDDALYGRTRNLAFSVWTVLRGCPASMQTERFLRLAQTKVARIEAVETERGNALFFGDTGEGDLVVAQALLTSGVLRHAFVHVVAGENSLSLDAPEADLVYRTNQSCAGDTGCTKQCRGYGAAVQQWTLERRQAWASAPDDVRKRLHRYKTLPQLAGRLVALGELSPDEYTYVLRNAFVSNLAQTCLAPRVRALGVDYALCEDGRGSGQVVAEIGGTRVALVKDGTVRSAQLPPCGRQASARAEPPHLFAAACAEFAADFPLNDEALQQLGAALAQVEGHALVGRTEAWYRAWGDAAARAGLGPPVPPLAEPNRVRRDVQLARAGSDAGTAQVRRDA